jgi:hypothetical protein
MGHAKFRFSDREITRELKKTGRLSVAVCAFVQMKGCIRLVESHVSVGVAYTRERPSR